VTMGSGRGGGCRTPLPNRKDQHSGRWDGTSVNHKWKVVTQAAVSGPGRGATARTGKRETLSGWKGGAGKNQRED